jgi:hypothetical protein
MATRTGKTHTWWLERPDITTEAFWYLLFDCGVASKLLRQDRERRKLAADPKHQLS